MYNPAHLYNVKYLAQTRKTQIGPSFMHETPVKKI